MSRLYRNWGKRLLDLTLAASGLLVLSPALGLIAVYVRRDLGAPVLFRQTRIGRDGRPFTLLKFRTMDNTTHRNGQSLSDSDRLTPFGLWLRSTSLDELPELWNVLRGEMSLVGPRPLLAQYLPLYSAQQSRRHEIRPGLTGWAQVNGRNAITWEKRFDLDVWYVDNISISLDARILWGTLASVATRRGISADGHATMPPFTG